ncbi:MAG: ABC transporter permease, partial [Acidobacteriota bacterium]
MTVSSKTTRFRFWLWLIHFIGVIVPRRFRARWHQEWEAELEYREAMLARWDRLNWQNKLELLWRSLGAFWDALWLQRERLEDEMIQNIRFGIRMLWKTPGFTATALMTLALCIGANLMIFAVVDAVLLRPLPFAEADRLVTIFNTYPKAGVENDGCSVTNYYERRGQIAAFSALAAYREGTAVIGEAGATEREQVTEVSPEFFSTLGAGPVIGRAFTDEETTYQTDGVVILT